MHFPQSSTLGSDWLWGRQLWKSLHFFPSLAPQDLMDHPWKRGHIFPSRAFHRLTGHEDISHGREVQLPWPKILGTSETWRGQL